jgi:hypothetical protein
MTVLETSHRRCKNCRSEVAVARDTEIEPANAPPFGVIVGVLTDLFRDRHTYCGARWDRLVMFDSVLVVAVTVVELSDVLVSVFND